jgi:nucleoside-diphosphate-sugar epimerase
MIAGRMVGRQPRRFLHSSLSRARQYGIRLSHRFGRLEPLGGPQPGVLLTGAGGTIGRVLRAGLVDSYTLRTVDQVPGTGIDLVADVRECERMEAACAGASAVVDLAANSRVDTSWATVTQNNIAAAVAILEAAHRAGVGRVILASSNHVTGMYERDEPYASLLAGRFEGFEPGTLRRIHADWPVRPDSFYAIGKCAAEAAGRYYAEEHGLSVICLRIGTVNQQDRPRNPREYATLLTHRDLVQLVRRCLEAPLDLRFAVFYGVSRNTWRIWDIEDARSALGYAPVDDAENFRGPTGSGPHGHSALAG